MKKVGLYFGSFNPIHVGHLIIADYFASSALVDEVVLVVSPHNPLKSKSELAPFEDRWVMTQMALKNHSSLSCSDVEASLSQPSFTIDTLDFLKEKNPENSYRVIMGQDSLESLHLWKNYRRIIEEFGIIVFPRKTLSDKWSEEFIHPHIVFEKDAPRLDISSTSIRSDIRAHRSIRYRVVPEVEEYIQSTGLYK